MTTQPEFQSLEAQGVREFWDHEAYTFTPWLENQVTSDGTSELEDVLELDLEIIEREKRVGSYNVDLYAEIPDDGRKVIIENQLSDSDHDHLGKAIAYASGVDAYVIVWIAPKFNDEHRDAFQWLNENSREGVALFAIRLEVWRIGESKPAVRLNPVAEPSEWKEAVKRGDRDLSETKELQQAFWTAFRDRIRDSETVLSPRKPKPQHWYNNPIGKAGFGIKFKMNTKENVLQAGILIRDDAEAYEELEAEREIIETEFSGDLEWIEPNETRAGKQRSQIICKRTMNLQDEDSWEDHIDWLAKHGEQFHDVFAPRIQEL